MSGEILISAQGLYKSYGKHTAVRGIDMHVAGGEVVALLGPNGSGKTTLMTMLVGLLRADGGTVDGDVKTCGWVPQGSATYSRLTVHENLVLFSKLLRLGGDHEKRAKGTARDTGLEPWLDFAVWQLSGGLRQRLNVAIGLLENPRCIILDEPSTGVDLVHRHALWEILRRRADAGGGALFSTHTIEDAAMADRVCVVVDGKLVFNGPIEDIARDEPSQRFPHIIDPIERGLIHLWGADVLT